MTHLTIKYRKLVKTVTVALLFIISSDIYAVTDDFTGWKLERSGDARVYSPPNLKQGERYSITLYNPQDIRNFTYNNWFKRYIANDEKNLGVITYRGKISHYEPGITATARKFRNIVGKEWNKVSKRYDKKYENQFALYVSVKIAKNKAGIMRMNYSSLDIFKQYKYGLDEVQKVMRRDGDNKYLENKLAINSRNKQKIAEHHNKKRALKQQNDIVSSDAKNRRRTQPNKGLKPLQVEAVLANKRINVIVGGFETTLHLLLQDGSIYKFPSSDPKIPPSDFDAEYSRKYEPDRWSKWRKVNSGKYEKLISAGNWEVVGGDVCIKGRVNETVSDRYGMHSGSSNFGSSSSYVSLKKNNHFELSSNSLRSSDGQSPYTAIMSSSSNKEGTSSVVTTSGPSMAGGSSASKKDGSKNTGTYRINGYTIELRHDNGWVRRELFCFYKPDKSSIIIDGEYYWISKE